MGLLIKLGLVIGVPALAVLAGVQSQRQPAPNPAKGGLNWTASKVAGSYYFGDGLGVNCSLNLSAQGTFSFRWTGCLGEYDKNSGPFHFEGDELVLEPTGKNSREGFEGTPTRFYPVSWGNRLYLIADEDMPGFCAAIARGWDGTQVLGAHGDHYVRDGLKNEELTKAAKGTPRVPAKFEPWIKTPMYVHVTRIEKDKFYVDRGSAEGLVKGVKLVGHASAFDWLVIEQADEHSSYGRMWQKDDKRPKVGAKLIAFDIELIN